MTASQRLAAHLALAIPAALLGGAYVSQYVFGLYPCEMCWWQRWPHFAAFGLALAAYALPMRAIWVALSAFAIATSGVIGGFHAGVEYGWWEGLTSCASGVVASGAEGVSALDNIMNAPLIRCDVAPWRLWGVSLAGWNFLISTGGAIAILVLIARTKRT